MAARDCRFLPSPGRSSTRDSGWMAPAPPAPVKRRAPGSGSAGTAMGFPDRGARQSPCCHVRNGCSARDGAFVAGFRKAGQSTAGIRLAPGWEISFVIAMARAIEASAPSIPIAAAQNAALGGSEAASSGIAVEKQNGQLGSCCWRRAQSNAISSWPMRADKGGADRYQVDDGRKNC